MAGCRRPLTRTPPLLTYTLIIQKHKDESLSNEIEAAKSIEYMYADKKEKERQ
jgi:hypothetical protein